MDSLISTFNIDIKLLLAQMINFAIVFAVLYFFALKPLLKVMTDRSSKIEKSLNEAKEIEEKLAKTEEDYGAELAKAKKEAAAIVEKAAVHAEEKRQVMLKKAKEEIGVIINEEKAKMQTEKAQVLKEIRSEVAGLVASSLEKILGEKLDAKKDKEIIKKMVK
jgi:F-type H+-transporting ATPase subunit b